MAQLDLQQNKTIRKVISKLIDRSNFIIVDAITMWTLGTCLTLQSCVSVPAIAGVLTAIRRDWRTSPIRTAWISTTSGWNNCKSATLETRASCFYQWCLCYKSKLEFSPEKPFRSMGTINKFRTMKSKLKTNKMTNVKQSNKIIYA